MGTHDVSPRNIPGFSHKLNDWFKSRRDLDDAGEAQEDAALPEAPSTIKPIVSSAPSTRGSSSLKNVSTQDDSSSLSKPESSKSPFKNNDLPSASSQTASVPKYICPQLRTTVSNSRMSHTPSQPSSRTTSVPTPIIPALSTISAKSIDPRLPIGTGFRQISATEIRAQLTRSWGRLETRSENRKDNQERGENDGDEKGECRGAQGGNDGKDKGEGRGAQVDEKGVCRGAQRGNANQDKGDVEVKAHDASIKSKLTSDNGNPPVRSIDSQEVHHTPMSYAKG